MLVHADDVVHQLARAAQDALLHALEARAEVAALHGLQHLDHLLDLAAALRAQELTLARRLLRRWTSHRELLRVARERSLVATLLACARGSR